MARAVPRAGIRCFCCWGEEWRKHNGECGALSGDNAHLGGDEFFFLQPPHPAAGKHGTQMTVNVRGVPGVQSPLLTVGSNIPPDLLKASGPFWAGPVR